MSLVFGLSPADDAFRHLEAPYQSIELDGNLAAHLSLGMVTFFMMGMGKASGIQTSDSIESKDAEALSYYAMFLGFVIVLTKRWHLPGARSKSIRFHSLLI